MVFFWDNGLADGWGTVLCRDTACIKLLFAWLLISASLCTVLVENNLRPGQSWPWSLPAPPPPKRSVPFHVPTLSHFASLPEVFGNHFPLYLFPILFPFLSTPFLKIMVFHPWWCYEWLALSLAVIWYATVLHKSFVFPHAESVACRIKLGLLFRGVTNLSHTSTNQFHYDHVPIRPGVPDQCSTGGREVPGNKSNRPSLHPFPCLPFTIKVPLRAALGCWVTDDICGAVMMEDHFSSSLLPCLSFVLSLFLLIPLNLLDK